MVEEKEEAVQRAPKVVHPATRLTDPRASRALSGAASGRRSVGADESLADALQAEENGRYTVGCPAGSGNGYGRPDGACGLLRECGWHALPVWPGSPQPGAYKTPKGVKRPLRRCIAAASTHESSPRVTRASALYPLSLQAAAVCSVARW